MSVLQARHLSVDTFHSNQRVSVFSAPLWQEREPSVCSVSLWQKKNSSVFSVPLWQKRKLLRVLCASVAETKPPCSLCLCGRNKSLRVLCASVARKENLRVLCAFYEAAVDSQAPPLMRVWKCGNPFCGFPHSHTPSFATATRHMRRAIGDAGRPSIRALEVVGTTTAHHELRAEGGAISVTALTSGHSTERARPLLVTPRHAPYAAASIVASNAV